LFSLSLEFRTFQDPKSLMLLHNATLQESKSEWSLVTILLLLKLLPGTSVFSKDRKTNLSWKVHNSSNSSEELSAKSAVQPHAIVQEQSRKLKKKTSNLELIQLQMVKNSTKLRTICLF